jgi:tetratricopeptide (TPR) repeat protein
MNTGGRCVEKVYQRERMIVGKSNKPIPLEIQVLNRQAMEMSSHGNYPDALKIFSQIVYVAPHFARAQFEMGRCLESLGRSKEAVERYDKAMRLDPHFAQDRSVTYTLMRIY